MVIKLLRV